MDWLRRYKLADVVEKEASTLPNDAIVREPRILVSAYEYHPHNVSESVIRDTAWAPPAQITYALSSHGPCWVSATIRSIES